MDKYIITGGKQLKGAVKISGSKNASLPILTASLLTDQLCVAHNVPDLKDIDTLCMMLSHLGKKVERKNNTIKILPGTLRYAVAPYDLVRKMRASVLVVGPMLARWKKVKVSLPGGCAIGPRPINIHIKGFKTMGCTVSMHKGYLCLDTPGLVGTRIVLEFPSVGATENLIMGATLAQGKTIIENAAREPEIVDLAGCLKTMGAHIFGEGSSTIAINGCERLHGFDYTVIPDRIETATFMIIAAITKGSVILHNTNPDHSTMVIDKLKEAGVPITIKGNTIILKPAKYLKAISIETAPYPGFPTDVQALWVVLMAKAQDVSVIKENIFEKRFMYVSELERMGAQVRVQGNSIVVKGTTALSGAPIMASDLRAGAALVTAALGAQSTSEILRIYHIDRGYELFEHKLRAIGATIKRVKQ